MSKHYCHCDASIACSSRSIDGRCTARWLSKNHHCIYRKKFPLDIRLQKETCMIRAVELDPNKVYTIILEAGDMAKDELFEYVTRIKALYEAQGINAIYSTTYNGIPMITINELTSETTENT